MSTTHANPIDEKTSLALTVKVIHNSLGRYTGIVKEWPIVVESDTIDELKENLTRAMSGYLLEKHTDIAKTLTIEVPA